MTSVGSGHRDLTTGLQSPRARGPRQAAACPGGVRGAWGAGPAVSSRPVSPGSSLCLLPGPACVFPTVALVASSVTWGLATGSRGGCCADIHRRQGAAWHADVQMTGSWGWGRGPCRRSDDREPRLGGWALQMFTGVRCIPVSCSQGAPWGTGGCAGPPHRLLYVAMRFLSLTHSQWSAVRYQRPDGHPHSAPSLEGSASPLVTARACVGP